MQMYFKENFQLFCHYSVVIMPLFLFFISIIIYYQLYNARKFLPLIFIVSFVFHVFVINGFYCQLFFNVSYFPAGNICYHLLLLPVIFHYVYLSPIISIFSPTSNFLLQIFLLPGITVMSFYY